MEKGKQVLALSNNHQNVTQFMDNLLNLYRGKENGNI